MSKKQEEELSQDTLFSLLSNPRRRFILQYLSRVEGPVTLQDLATEVAAWENETDPEDLTDKERKRLYVSLYQTHIPKLDDVGVIEYDQDSGEIQLTDQVGDLSMYLDGDVQPDRNWELYYLALAIVGGFVFALIFGLLSVGELVTAVIGLAWAVALAALALYHYSETK